MAVEQRVGGAAELQGAALLELQAEQRRDVDDDPCNVVIHGDPLQSVVGSADWLVVVELSVDQVGTG